MGHSTVRRGNQKLISFHLFAFTLQLLQLLSVFGENGGESTTRKNSQKSATGSESKVFVLSFSRISNETLLKQNRSVGVYSEGIKNSNYSNFTANEANNYTRVKRAPYLHQYPLEPLYSAPLDRAYLSKDYIDEEVPEEGSIYPRFHSPRHQRRPPPPRRRGPSSPRHGAHPPPRIPSHAGPPRSRPIPLPLPPNYSRRLPPSPQKQSYSYPRDAANIQDILSYFKKEEREATRPSPTHAPDLSHVSMGGDFSKELHDVQTSLLKDIREFAQRPNMISHNVQESTQPTTTTHNPPAKSTTYEARGSSNKESVDQDNEEDDDILTPKAKPVREMIKDRPIPLPKNKYRSSKQNGWSQGESSEEKRRYQGSGRNRYEDEEDEKVLEGEERPQKNYASRERYGTKRGKHSTSSRLKPGNGYGTRLRLRPGDDSEENEEDFKGESARRDRVRGNKAHSTKHSSRYAGGTYRSDEKDDRHSREDEHENRYRNHRYGDNSRDAYAHTTTTAPIIIKQPYGHYKVPPKGHYHQDRQRSRHGWNSNERGSDHDSYQASNHLPPPQQYAHQSVLPKSHYHRPTVVTAPPPVPEIEDIVEIHTGGAPPYKTQPLPPPQPTFQFREPERDDRDRKNHIHKLYLEYLEKKLEAETLAAVAATTNTAPYVPPYHPQPASYPPPPAYPPPQQMQYQPVPSPKLSPPPPPMRMKIHIYPNENADTTASVGSERHYNYQAPTFPPPRTSFSTQTPIVPQYGHPLQNRHPGSYGSYGNFNQRSDTPFSHGPPPRDPYITPTQTQRPLAPNNGLAMSGVTGNTQKTGNGPSTGVDKNKNLVLHLHVHRRNDDRDSMPGASDMYTTTVKPLTYKDIYDQVQEQQRHQGQLHQFEEQKGYMERTEQLNKSVSMEVPIRDERFEDVIQSLLKFRPGQ